MLQGQVSSAESTLERQKLRAQALADEVGALIEQAARRILGKLLLSLSCMILSSASLQFVQLHLMPW